MGPQFLKTASGDELVVLSRRDYDVLLARLGDEDAEDRLLFDMAEQTRRDLGSGKEFVLPVWFTDSLMTHRSPVRTVREHFLRSTAEFCGFAGLTEEQLNAIEQGVELPSVGVLDAISTSVDIDLRILRRMYDQPDHAA